jgi:glycine/D-amino acid oxidase-like deaminating enzyme
MRSAIVVGAGMAGLSTAWFLQEHGFEITVVERRRVAAGASWGNAGWLTPAFTVPLPGHPGRAATGRPDELAQGVRVRRAQHVASRSARSPTGCSPRPSPPGAPPPSWRRCTRCADRVAGPACIRP